VVLVHHTGWSDTGRIRGHSSWIGAADVSLKLARNIDDPELIELTAQKMKDDQLPEKILFKLKPYQLVDMLTNFGAPEFAAVIERVTGPINAQLENCKARFKQACEYWGHESLLFTELKTFLTEVEELEPNQVNIEMLATANGLVGTLHKHGLIKLDNFNSKVIMDF
jgi:hypothetical protein